jgi:hypothetical protein
LIVDVVLMSQSVGSVDSEAIKKGGDWLFHPNQRGWSPTGQPTTD